TGCTSQGTAPSDVASTENNGELMSAPKNRDSENTVVERDAQDTGTTATATTSEQKVDADLIAERAEQEQKARRRAVVGLFVGVLLAILVYAIFPADAADVVNKAHPDAEKRSEERRVGHEGVE